MSRPWTDMPWAYQMSDEWRDYWCDRCQKGRNGKARCNGRRRLRLDDAGNRTCSGYVFDVEAWEARC